MSIDLTPELEEQFIRTRIQELNERITVLQDKSKNGDLGPRVIRARLRWLRADYEWLADTARSHGYKIA